MGDYWRNTSLQRAVDCDLAYIVKKYLDENTNLNTAMLLGYAVAQERINCIKLLIERGADLEYRYEGEGDFTLAHKVAAYGTKPEILDILVGAGVDIEKVTRGYRCLTPLTLAIRFGKTEMVKRLLELGASFQVLEWWYHGKDDRDWSILHLAAMDGKTEIVEVLIQAGVDKDKKSELGWTPIMIAVTRGRIEVVKALIKAGASLSGLSPWGYTLLVEAVSDNYIEMVKLLVEAGLSITEACPCGATAIYIANLFRYTHIVEYLESMLATRPDVKAAE